MKVREVVSKLVDADVNLGARAPVVVMRKDGLMYQITKIEIGGGEEDGEGNRIDTGQHVVIQVEEF